MLSVLGIDFEVFPAAIDEDLGAYPDPHAAALGLAEEKARVVAERFPLSCVLSADTLVVKLEDKEIFGKPENPKHAELMLAELQGRAHLVCTGFVILRKEPDFFHRQLVETRVSMKDLSQEEIENYVQTGEPMDKAGAYAIQGIGSAFVSEINGSYTNVVGLPLTEVLEVLHQLTVWHPAQLKRAKPQ